VPSSFFAVISIFTPLGGMVEVIVTVKSKGPLDAARFEPTGGFKVTARLASVVPPPPPPPPPPFLQPEDINIELIKNKDNNRSADFISAVYLRGEN
jgi:hypothetical protein